MRMNKSGHIWIAILLAGLVFLLLLGTAFQIGLTWDETSYIAAARSYMSWFKHVLTDPAQAFSEQGIESGWTVNHEHPPMDKVWSGAIFTLTKHWTDDLTAHRIGNMLLVAILAGLIYLWMAMDFGRVAGFAAVAALISMPRFFFHAHLAALDVPAAFSVFVTTFVFWKLLSKKSWAWGLLLGLVWGLALATKINAVFIPVVFGVWWLIFRRDGKTMMRFVIMGFTAIFVFFLVWPWMYVHTLDRIIEFLLFMTSEHYLIGQYYLGQFFMPPPWHFTFVILWAVLPLGLTLLYMLGIFRTLRVKEDRALGGLLILSALVPMLALASGKTLVYDNDRLMMVTFPFLACLAGVGFNWLFTCWQSFAQRFSRPIFRWIGLMLLIGLAFGPQIVSMVRLYPHLLSYYGESVGGLPGATRMGLETTYWCETYTLALPILNEQAEKGDIIWADPWSHDVLIYYQTQGRLREDLVILFPGYVVSILGQVAPDPVVKPMDSADWFLFQHRQTALGPELDKSEIAQTLAKQTTVYEYEFDGVPVFTLYQAAKK